MIPSLKDAKKNGLKAFLKKKQLVVNGLTYDVGYGVKNIQLGEGDGLGILRNRVEGSEEISQETGNAALGRTSHKALNSDRKCVTDDVTGVT